MDALLSHDAVTLIYNLLIMTKEKTGCFKGANKVWKCNFPQKHELEWFL